jgi:hypothetical protein
MFGSGSKLRGVTVKTHPQLHVAAIRTVGRVDLHVVRHEQIQIAITIEVGEGAAGAPRCRSNVRGGGDISEHTMAGVAIEDVRASIRHVEIDPAVVVVVGRARPHPVVAMRDSGSHRHVLEQRLP